MRRLAFLILAAVLLAVPLGPASAGSSTKEKCTKIRHEKTVYVQVKRKGKLVWVKRHRVWWTCDPYAAPGPPRLAVVAKEFKFTFSRPYVKPGKLILEFDNQGEDTHNLRLGPLKGGKPFAKVGSTEPRKQETVIVPLKAGTYRMWCSLPGHAKAGMRTKLRVATKP